MTLATQTQLRRGTSTQCDALTGAAGEPFVDTSNWRFRLGDGATAGGYIIPNAFDIQKRTFMTGMVGGTANAITLTLAPVPAAYTQNLTVMFLCGSDNTGATTINVNSLGAKNLMKNVAGTLTALASGDLQSGVYYTATYDGTQFQVRIDASSGLSSVSQGNLNTSTGSVSGSAPAAGSGGGPWNLSTGNINVIGTLPGGEYAFALESKITTGGTCFVMAGTDSTSYLRRALAGMLTSAGRTVTIQERYVTASPPFDLGDGPLAGFIFLRQHRTKGIVGSYIADVPPWAYNGPTDIRAHKICPVTGKKYRRAVRPRSLEERIRGAALEFEYEEITQAIKNADMPLIPHPFQGLESTDERIILLNPRDDRLARIMEHHDNGGAEDVVNALHEGNIYPGDLLPLMKGPPGVSIARLEYKYTS